MSSLDEKYSTSKSKLKQKINKKPKKEKKSKKDKNDSNNNNKYDECSSIVVKWLKSVKRKIHHDLTFITSRQENPFQDIIQHQHQQQQNTDKENKLSSSQSQSPELIEIAKKVLIKDTTNFKYLLRHPHIYYMCQKCNKICQSSTLKEHNVPTLYPQEFNLSGLYVQCNECC